MAEQQPAPPAQAPQAPQDMTQPIFSVERIYVKDMSLEVPSAPQVFLKAETPQVDINIHTGASVVEAGALYEVVLTATVTAKTPERTIFLVEVAQAGLFHIRNLAPQDLDAAGGGKVHDVQAAAGGWLGSMPTQIASHGIDPNCAKQLP